MQHRVFIVCLLDTIVHILTHEAAKNKKPKRTTRLYFHATAAGLSEKTERKQKTLYGTARQWLFNCKSLEVEHNLYIEQHVILFQN